MQSANQRLLILWIAAASFVAGEAAILTAVLQRAQTPAEIVESSFRDIPITFETVAKPRIFSDRFEAMPMSRHVEDRRDPLGELFLDAMKAVRN